jgi:hypothetical protein
MAQPPTTRVGDIVEMRKPHPCGANRWIVVRTGADIRVRCTACGRTALMPRGQFFKAVRRFLPAQTDTPEADSSRSQR